MRFRFLSRCSLAIVVLECGALIGTTGVTASALSTPMVVRPDGAPAAGAQVIEIGWPTQDTERSGGVTGTVATVELARTTTDADGNYDLPSVSPTSLQALTNPDGSVNIKTMVLGDGYEGMASDPILVTSATDAAADRSAAVQLPTPEVQTFAAATASAAATTSAAPDDDNTTCGTRRLATYGKRLTIVGSVWSWTKYANQAFTYAYGGSSGLGVGVSSSGSYGSFSDEGEQKMTATLTEGFPAHKGIQAYHERTYYVPAKYVTTCTQQLPHRSWNTYFVQARYYAGGKSESHLSAKSVPLAEHCVPEAAKSFTDVTKTIAATHSEGFEVGDLIGLSLHARSGWSNEVRLHIYWSGYTRFCGTLAYPGRPATVYHGELVARGR